jgi:MFS family permease
MERQREPWLAALIICLGFFMIMLDTTIVLVALPAIVGGLGASLDAALWVVNAYLLVYAVLLITTGRLGDVLGQRPMFAAGLVVFTIASALCGLSADAGQLIAARALQGLGGAMMAPQSLAMLTLLFRASAWARRSVSGARWSAFRRSPARPSAVGSSRISTGGGSSSSTFPSASLCSPARC